MTARTVPLPRQEQRGGIVADAAVTSGPPVSIRTIPELSSPVTPGGPGEEQEQHLPMYYFTITHDRDGWRARFYYSGELMWWTEGYSSEAGARNAIQSLRVQAAAAPLR